MTQWDKLIADILNLAPSVRFAELAKVLKSYGYVMGSPRRGSSHYTFRKEGCNPITIPKHNPIKKPYLIMVRDVIEGEADGKR